MQVAAVAREHGVHTVSRELRLDHNVLKMRATTEPIDDGIDPKRKGMFTTGIAAVNDGIRIALF